LDLDRDTGDLGGLSVVFSQQLQTNAEIVVPLVRERFLQNTLHFQQSSNAASILTSLNNETKRGNFQTH
jgi:hypothetical protein